MALWLAQAGSLSSVFHTRNVFTAGCPISSGDLFDYTCSNHCPAFQTRNSCLCAFPQTSIRRLLINLGPAVWCGHSGGPPCLRQQSSLICSAQSTVPMGTRNFVSDKEKYTRETGWLCCFPFKSRREGKVSTVPTDGPVLPELDWWLLKGFCKTQRVWTVLGEHSCSLFSSALWRVEIFFFLARLHYDMF